MNIWRNHSLITCLDFIFKLTEINDKRKISRPGPYHKKFSPQRAAEKKRRAAEYILFCTVVLNYSVTLPSLQTEIGVVTWCHGSCPHETSPK